MAKVLLVEDSRDFRLMVKSAFAGSDLTLIEAGSAGEAVQVASTDRFDLVLLDLGLPDSEGLDICGRLRAVAGMEDVPIILLTGNQDVSTKVSAFSLGAEDYIVKPFDSLELRARVEAKLRRREKRGRVVEEKFQVADLLIEVPFQRVTIVENGRLSEELDLTATEFKLLFWLARNPDSDFTREQLLAHVWGLKPNILVRTVDAHVCSLRRKLGGRSAYVQSVPGKGYRFSLDRKSATRSAA